MRFFKNFFKSKRRENYQEVGSDNNAKQVHILLDKLSQFQKYDLNEDQRTSANHLIEALNTMQRGNFDKKKYKQMEAEYRIMEATRRYHKTYRR